MKEGRSSITAQRIADLEIWLIGALVVASLFRSQLLMIVVVTSFIFFGVHKAAYGYFSRRTPVDWGISLLTIMALISLLIAYLPGITLVQVLRLFSGIALLSAVVNWGLTPRRLDLLIILLMIAGIGLAFFALISVEWAITKMNFLPREVFDQLTILVADTANPNVMAGSLVLLAPIAFSLLIFGVTPQVNGKYRGMIKILMVATFVILTVVIIMTLSRAAWMAYLLAIVSIISLRWRWGWVAVIALVIFGAGLFSLNSEVILNALLASQNLGTIAGRLEVWARAVFMIDDFPLTGIGMGLFKNVAELYYPFALVSVDRVSHAHNLFLQIALDLGLPGLIAWLSILFGSVVTSIKLHLAGKETGNLWLAGVGAGFLGSALAMITHGFLDAVTWGGVRPAPLVWALWGCVFALGNCYLSFQKD